MKAKPKVDAKLLSKKLVETLIEIKRLEEQKKELTQALLNLGVEETDELKKVIRTDLVVNSKVIEKFEKYYPELIKKEVNKSLLRMVYDNLPKKFQNLIETKVSAYFILKKGE